jgi:hypothetical protein
MALRNALLAYETVLLRTKRFNQRRIAAAHEARSLLIEGSLPELELAWPIITVSNSKISP